MLDLLRSHHCEEASGRLLDVRVREMKVSRYAIGPLSKYLTRSQSGKLLSALALAFGRSFPECRALIGLLEDRPTEEMKGGGYLCIAKVCHEHQD